MYVKLRLFVNTANSDKWRYTHCKQLSYSLSFTFFLVVSTKAIVLLMTGKK